MLYAADLAEQVTAVCTTENSLFAVDTRGPMGDMHFYAQHIKGEVIIYLSENETLAVLKAAADMAKAETLATLSTLRSGPVEFEHARVLHWCETAATSLVYEVISTHDNHHDEIDELLARAKKD